MAMTRVLCVLFTMLWFGCQRDSGGAGAGSGSAAGAATGSATATTTAAGSGSAGKRTGLDIDSKDILARTTTAPAVTVKHVLLAWKDLAATYGPQMDPRAAKRSNGEAAALAKEIAGKLRLAPDSIDALVKEHSEDPGSKSGEPYEVKADTAFVPEFKALALRLKEKEAGIVRTDYGYHVIMRVMPPPPDPLESTDILARPAGTEKVHVQHVLVSWKDAPIAARRPVDPRAQQRTKADADKLALELLAKVRAKGDMAALMKEYSEDPGSKDTGRAYQVDENTPFVEGFKNLALRLQLDEAGLAKTPFGWHVIKRIPEPPPPPPDSLDSVDILKRPAATDKAKVKHVLLGWDGASSGDPRGKRDRKALEKLVKETVAKLKKGAKIEPLMAELSEDGGSAKTGQTYDVTPSSALVDPFKNLSLRLKVKEVGVVKSQFGIHIIQRTE